MNLIGRLLLLLLRGFSYPGDHPPLEAACTPFRVMPHDLDFNRHVNNARYLQFMDLGRLDLLNRLGLVRLAFRNKWFPVLGGVVIRFHRPLHLLQRIELYTRVVGWDEKWFYLEQRFVREEKPVATAYARALLRGPGRSLPTEEVLASIGLHLPSPPLPPELAGLHDPAPAAASEA